MFVIEEEKKEKRARETTTRELQGLLGEDDWLAGMQGCLPRLAGGEDDRLT